MAQFVCLALSASEKPATPVHSAAHGFYEYYYSLLFKMSYLFKYPKLFCKTRYLKKAKSFIIQNV
jgi:hypothetical protein